MRAVAVLLLTCSLMSASMIPAAAEDGDVGVSCGFGICTTTAGRGHTGGSASPGRQGCQFNGQQVSCESAAGDFDSVSGCYVRTVDPATVPAGPVRTSFETSGGSVVYLSACLAGGQAGGFQWRPPAGPVVTAAAVREQVVRLVPSAAVGLAPATSTLVNIQTIVWVDTPAVRDLPQVTIAGHQVVIHLTLDHVAYDFGDDTTDTQRSAGKPYDPVRDPCRARMCPDYDGHVYRSTGTKTVTASVIWQVDYTVDAGPTQHLDQPVPGPAATATVQVNQARAVLVPTP